MKFSFHPEAQAEFFKAVTYYEECEVGLGDDFALAIDEALQRIVDFPNAWHILEGDVRRCLTHRFPFGILYCIEPDGIFILAVMDLRRDPDYWKHRKPMV